MSKVYVLHENDAWMGPFRAAFDELGIPFAEWHLDRGVLDLSKAPPEGVFYNRMSASSHTRGHRYAPEYTACVLAWLEAHGRTVVNGTRALSLEINKIAQYTSLGTFGVETPRTIAVVGDEGVLEAAKAFGDAPFITKHNRAGKGLGVRLFRTQDSFEAHFESPEYEPSVDGILLLQQYIAAPQPFITRVEFVGGELVYAVRVDSSQGFELCPAEACRIDDAFCPVGETAPAMFEVIDGFDHPLVPRWKAFLKANAIGIAGIEFIVDANGKPYTYDVNTNTNYNPDAEAKAGIRAALKVAEFLGRELEASQGAVARRA